MDNDNVYVWILNYRAGTNNSIISRNNSRDKCISFFIYLRTNWKTKHIRNMLLSKETLRFHQVTFEAVRRANLPTDKYAINKFAKTGGKNQFRAWTNFTMSFYLAIAQYGG